MASSATEGFANLFGLSVLSIMMSESRDEDEILQLAMGSVPAVAPCTAQARYVQRDGLIGGVSADGHATNPDLDAQVIALGGRHGAVSAPPATWGWAFALCGRGSQVGYLVVTSAAAPSTSEFFMLTMLAEQTGTALANTGLYRAEREQGDRLSRLREEGEARQLHWRQAASDLRRQRTIQQVLTEASTSGEGEAAIAHALHDLTGLSVAIEDQFGNLRSWSGPGRPEQYRMVGGRRRNEVIRRADRDRRPVRDRTRLIAAIRPGQQLLGTLALIDPTHRAGQLELAALEYGAMVLALELTHQRQLAETELRLRRDVVDDLVTGMDDESAYARSAAVGHDLHGPHYVVVIEWRGERSTDSIDGAVARAALDLGLRPLVGRRASRVLMLLPDRPDGAQLHRAIRRDNGGGPLSIGVGGRSDVPRDLPRSLQQGLRALQIRQDSRSPDGHTVFDELGVYRILGLGGSDDLELYVGEWLGLLRDYDNRRHTELVQTLHTYLECGGNYDLTADALMVHRSTLRYRLHRIREITGFDLADVDTRLNLHVASRAWRILKG